MKHISIKYKLALLSACTISGIIAYFTAYNFYLSEMTEWQKDQTISFESNTGSTKFKAHIDSAIIAGLVFCASAITITSLVKFTKKK